MPTKIVKAPAAEEVRDRTIREWNLEPDRRADVADTVGPGASEGARASSPGTKAPDSSPKDPISGQTAQRVLGLLSSFYSWAIPEDRHEPGSPGASRS